MVKVLGNYSSIERKRSNLFSLDLALSSRAEMGVPMRTLMELYGYSNTGKSTLAYYLSGVLTGKGNVVICDLENADRKYIKTATESAGLDGDVYLMDSIDPKGKPIPHEDMLQNLALKFDNENTGIAILDSVGAIMPIAESKGDFGEAFMGKRAKLVAQVSRKFTNAVRNKERACMGIVINHVHQILGGKGHVTAGGVTLTYLTAIRLMIWPSETVVKSEEDPKPIGFHVKGKVEKLRYGGRGREFGYYIVPEYGVHVGASAMFDCFELGLADRDNTVKMGGKSFGYLKKDLLSYAYAGKQRKFEPFVERLKEYEKEVMSDPDFSNGFVESTIKEDMQRQSDMFNGTTKKEKDDTGKVQRKGKRNNVKST